MMAPSKVPIRILLIDDHAIVRNGVRLLLEGHPGVIVVGEADKCSDAIALARRERPDVIVLEFLQEEENGIDFIAELLNVSTQSRVLVLTGAADRNLHHRAVRLGAMGIVLKKKEPEVLFKAIEKIHQGEAWLDRSTIATVLARMSRPGRDEESSEAAKIKTLTKRERDIITLVAQGLKNKQVAERLAISDVTVRHHLTSVFSKLDVADRSELIIYTYKHGLASLGMQNGNGR